MIFSPLFACASLLAQHDSIHERLYVQAELTWYGAGPANDLSNRLVRSAAIRRLGFAGTRLPVEWARIEVIRGRPDWGRLDSVVSELQGNGLEAYGVIAYSPKWAVPAAYAQVARIDSHRPVVDGSPAKGDTLFAAFAAAAARRYRGRIDRWEIWNEENHPPFWIDIVGGVNRGPDPADYGRLFSLARDSIQAANPNAEVAVGGLSSLNGNPHTWPDPIDSTRAIMALTPEVYIRGLAASGVSFGVIALHPYSRVVPGARVLGRGVIFPDLVVDSVIATLDQLGLKHIPIWVTEWGVDARLASSQNVLDLWFHDALGTLLCQKRIAFVTVHALMDDNPQEHFGLLRSDGTETADGLAFRRTVSAWKGCL
jgi:hypothetical protein